ncbi:Hypothetical protein FKW44_010313, partial [Caligus rogercresseyi]
VNKELSYKALERMGWQEPVKENKRLCFMSCTSIKKNIEFLGEIFNKENNFTLNEILERERILTKIRFKKRIIGPRDSFYNFLSHLRNAELRASLIDKSNKDNYFNQIKRKKEEYGIMASVPKILNCLRANNLTFELYWLKYRIVTNTLPLGSIFGRTPDERMCFFCKSSLEKSRHFLLECPIVVKFLDLLKNEFFEDFNLSL